MTAGTPAFIRVHRHGGHQRGLADTGGHEHGGRRADDAVDGGAAPR
ncbi:MAG TPA: hypothetical protein VG327_18305 [Mycobacterium sp.]|nr:hypothetical protein [Mycobacterium sp.]